MENSLNNTDRAKLVAGRKVKTALKKRLNIPAPLKAIRQKCLDCVCGSAVEVKKCHIEKCPLWSFRFGRPPSEDDLKVPEFDNQGNITRYHDYEEYNGQFEQDDEAA